MYLEEVLGSIAKSLSIIARRLSAPKIPGAFTFRFTGENKLMPSMIAVGNFNFKPVPVVDRGETIRRVLTVETVNKDGNPIMQDFDVPLDAELFNVNKPDEIPILETKKDSKVVATLIDWDDETPSNPSVPKVVEAFAKDIFGPSEPGDFKFGFTGERNVE